MEIKDVFAYLMIIFHQKMLEYKDEDYFVGAMVETILTLTKMKSWALIGRVSLQMSSLICLRLEHHVQPWLESPRFSSSR